MRALLLVATLLLVGCSMPGDDGSDTSPSPSGTSAPATSAPATQTADPTSEPAEPKPVRFEATRAMRDVRRLAGGIGPRLATSPAYAEAAALVAERFRELGYDVRRQGVRVPAGDSWGVPVEAGRSANVIAEPDGFDPADPHLVVGAHLDTIAVTPGAEDNASGVSVLLELARLASLEPPRLPTVFIAFGAEEPVGPGDALHHFGSRHYVAGLGDGVRSIRGMVAMDRVGVGGSVPVCAGLLEPPRLREVLLRVARRLGITAHSCENRTSDHWSFEKAGVRAARLGSTPYAAYHSAADVPAVVNRAQLDRVGRLAWGWLRTG